MRREADYLRPRISIMEAQFLFDGIRKTLNFAGLLDFSEMQIQVMTEFAEKLEESYEMNRARKNLYDMKAFEKDKPDTT